MAPHQSGTNVSHLMSGELGTWLADQSSMREEAKAKASSRWSSAAFVVLPALAFLWFGPSWSGSLKLFLTGFALFGAWGWGYIPIQEAKKKIKIGINDAIAREMGLSYDHEIEPGREFEFAKTYELVPNFTRSNFEDHWFGELEGHRFQLYEAHLEVRKGSGKNRRWVTVFRGAIIRMEFGQSFRSTTLLQRAGKNKTWFGLGGRKEIATFDGHDLAYVDHVHPDFEDVFEVYSDDAVESRVLVHPSYIEHLIAIERAFDGDAVRALFKDGTVIIAVESGNLFESGHIEADKDAERVAECAEQFGSLAQLALAINQKRRGPAQG